MTQLLWKSYAWILQLSTLDCEVSPHKHFKNQIFIT